MISTAYDEEKWGGFFSGGAAWINATSHRVVFWFGAAESGCVRVKRRCTTLVFLIRGGFGISLGNFKKDAYFQHCKQAVYRSQIRTPV